MKMSISARVLILLIMSTMAIYLWRFITNDPGQLPFGDSTWSIRFSADLPAMQQTQELRIAPPWNTEYAQIYSQSIFHPGLQQRRNKKPGQAREIVLYGNLLSGQVQTRFELQLSEVSRPVAKLRLKETDRSNWLIESSGIQINTESHLKLLGNIDLANTGKTDLLQTIFDRLSDLVIYQPQGTNDGNDTLQKRPASDLGIARAMVSVLRGMHIPSRVVAGIDLSQTNARQPLYWSEAYVESHWLPMDIARGYFAQLPPHFIPVQRGGGHIMQIDQQAIPFKVEINSITPPSGLSSQANQSPWQIFNLLRISPEGREALALLILLPIGVLATEFLRQIVGIRTYGTFTPSLLALAAVYTNLTTAIAIFLLVIVFGVAGRALLPGLKLSRVARLSVVFTMVASIMVFAVSGLIYLDPSMDTAVVLLPIVILTSLVDSVYKIIDEKGAVIALQRLWWTSIAALVSLMIMFQIHWGHWLLAFPESHMITIALIILLGQYHYTRLCDFRFCHWLTEKPAAHSRPSAADDSVN